MTPCDECGGPAPQRYRMRDGRFICDECCDARIFRQDCLAVLGEVIVAAIEAEKMAEKYKWVQCECAPRTAADWPTKWVMRHTST